MRARKASVGLLLAASIVGVAGIASAALTATVQATGYSTVTAGDGALGTNEYGTGNAQVFTGGGAGFGGTVGSAQLYVANNEDNLYLALDPGADLNDVAVIYLNTRAGGFTDADMDDNGDGARRAVSNLGGVGNDVFPAMSSAPDFAVAVGNFGIVVFELNAGSTANHLEFKQFDGTHTGNNPALVREIAIPWATLETAGGKPVNVEMFVAYTSDTNFLSNESIPASAGLNGAANPSAIPGTATYDNHVLYRAAGAPGALEPLWFIRAASATSQTLGNDNNNRGMALNPVTGNVIVTRGASGTSARVLNGATGATVVDLNVSTATIGTATLTRARAFATGSSTSSLYAVNLITDNKTTSFHIHRWAFTGTESNAVVPTLAYRNRASDAGTAEASPVGPVMPAAGATTVRLGDNLDGISDGTTTRLYLFPAISGTGGASNVVYEYVISEASGLVTAVNTIPVTGLTGATVRGVAFTGLNSGFFLSNNVAAATGYYPYDGTTVGTRQALSGMINAGTYVSSVGTVGGNTYLGFIDGNSYTGGGFRRFGLLAVDTSGATIRNQAAWFGPVLEATATPGVVAAATANGNATGDVLFDSARGRVFAMVTNNYIAGYNMPVADRTVRWDGGAGDGLWKSAANWDTNEVPNFRDNVILDNTYVSGAYAVSLSNDLPNATAASNTVNFFTNPVKSLQVGYAGNVNTIQLNLVSTSPINLLVRGALGASSANSIVVEAGGVLNNSSTAASGNVVENLGTNSATSIANGGRYIHDTGRSFATPFPATGNGIVTFAANSTFEVGDDMPAGALTFSGRTYGNYLIGNQPAAKTFTASGSGIATIAGTLTIGTNATFNSTVTNFFINGNVVNNGAGAIGGGATAVRFDGNTTISGSGTPLTFPTGIFVSTPFSLTTNHALVLPASTTSTVRGTFNANAPVTINGTLHLDMEGVGESLLGGTDAITVGSGGTLRFMNKTLPSLATGPAGGIIVDPAGRILISSFGAFAFQAGAAFPTSIPGTLEVANQSTVTLASPTTVGILALVDGRVVGDITATTINRTLGHVNGTLTRNIDGTVTGARAFPVGNGTDYAPVSVDITAAGTGTGTIAVSTAATAGASLPASVDEINRTWNIASTGITGATYSVDLTYLDGDLNSVDETTLVAARFNGSAWETKTTTINAGTNTATATGVTEFSPWTLYKTNPVPGASVASLAFGNVTVGNSADLSFDATNTGSADYNITAINSDNGQFTVISPSLFPVGVPVGGTVNVTVRFTPSAAAAASGTLTIDADSGTDPTVSLGGTGVSGLSDWTLLND